jgi:hypothetical protein
MVEKNTLEQTILGLATFFDNEAKEQNAEFIQILQEKFNHNEELYDSEITLAFLHFSSFAALPWLFKNPQVTNGWEKSYIQFIYNGLLPHFVRKVIEKNEGSCCSGDKEAFIIRKIKESVATGTNISLYQTYEGIENIDKEKWDEQAYWSPRSFKDTDDVKAQFRKWYNME